MGKGALPPFYEQGAYPFQDMCRDLFAEQPGIATCDLYGKSGETQYGIDLLARRRGDEAIEVGQCKCYQTFPAHKIKQASDDFLAHWEDRWSKANVKRFILFVACDLSSTRQQDMISEQRRRFAGYGIDY